MERSGVRSREAARRASWALSAGSSLWLAMLAPAWADTLEQALVQAYQNNPQLNSHRAATRAVDESVAVALGGYRPRVTATASSNEVFLETLSRTGVNTSARTLGENAVTSVGGTATQTLFNGFQTSNRTRQAEA